MTIQEFIDQMNAIATDVESAIAVAKTFVPNAQIDAALEIADVVIPIAEDLATKALTAWQGASGQAITVDSVKALMPDQTPLTPPKA